MPELMEELVEEVLVRFPPDDPASLVRAALVCKSWCRLVSGTAFRRRFREFHIHRGAATPLLGVLYTSTTKPQQQVRDDDDRHRRIKRARIDIEQPTACFVPTTTSFRRGPAHDANSRRYCWRAIDARHGRVLLRRCDGPCPWTYGQGLSVWDPVTDEQRDLPEPSFDKKMLGYSWSAAVVCAATAGGSCDHLDCHRGPFLVVVMDVQGHVMYRSVYSSEAGAWSHLEVLKRPDPTSSLGEFKQTPGVLVGSALYFLVHFNDEIVEYDLATQDVSAIDVPSEFHGLLGQRSAVLVTDDDGGLGFLANTNTDTEYQQLELWSMVNGGEGGFVPRRVIDLHKLLPLPAGAAINNNSLRVNGFGFAEGEGGGASRFLFMRTSDGLYSIEINSSNVSKVANNCCGDDEDNVVVPYLSFCTPNSFQGSSTVGVQVLKKMGIRN